MQRCWEREFNTAEGTTKVKTLRLECAVLRMGKGQLWLELNERGYGKRAEHREEGGVSLYLTA